jgi:hypothetical protein
VSKGESVTSGLAILAIGMIVVGFQPWWSGVTIATIGAAIALIAICRPDPVVSRTRWRLLRLAQAALEMATTAKTDGEFGLFHRKWWAETVALRDFVQAQYGLRARDSCMDNPLYHREDVTDFAAALNDLAGKVG